MIRIKRVDDAGCELLGEQLLPLTEKPDCVLLKKK